MSSKEWSVYILTLPKEISGYEYDKSYVGITRREPKVRWGYGGNRYKQNPQLWSDIQKYKWDSFIHRVPFKVESEDDACRMEKILVCLLKSNNSTFGYNKTTGGKGAAGVIYTEEQLAERSKINKEKWTRPTYREKMTGENAFFKHHKFIFKGKDNVRSLKVKCLNTGEVFDCIMDATRKYNIDNSCIGKCCKGLANSAGKTSDGTPMKWCYVK